LRPSQAFPFLTIGLLFRLAIEKVELHAANEPFRIQSNQSE